MKYFDGAYCVHYPNPDRREAVEKQFQMVGVAPEYIYARRPWHKFDVTNMRRNPPIEFACNMSHLKAVMASFDDKRPVIFEDDVIFSPAWEKQLDDAFAVLPDDWDLLYFGGHPREKVHGIGNNVYRVKTFSCAEGYAFNNGAQRRFAQFWCDRIAKEKGMYDFILGDFAAENNAYAVYPTITRQADGYSEIAGRNDEKGALIERGWISNL